MKALLFMLTCGVLNGFVSSDDLPPPCSSEIYCYGRVIDNVMKAHIFNDSKTYVDLKLKKTPKDTLERFDEFMLKVDNHPTQDQLQAWVEDNFDPTGSELEYWEPIDQKTDIELYNKIADKNLKGFASDLNKIWSELSRKMKDEVKVSLDKKKDLCNDFD